MIFVDSGAWLASFVESDPDHAAAGQWLKANRLPLVTSDFVVSGTLTLFRARRFHHEGLELGKRFFSREIAVVRITEIDFAAAWQTFSGYTDKEWSFVDCTSKVVMERLGITTSFSFDHHFHQFGSVQVVPEI